MLSNKIFNTLKNNSKSAIIKALNLNGGQAFAQQQRFMMMPYMRLAQFGSCGTSGGSGGCAAPPVGVRRVDLLANVVAVHVAVRGRHVDERL